MLNKIKKYFIAGLIVILPVFLTAIFFRWLLNKINAWFLEPFIRFARPYFDSVFAIALLKIILFFVIIAFIVLIGIATRVIFLRRFFGAWERLLDRMPLIKKIYFATKEISQTLFGGKKGLFTKAVLVEYPSPGLFAVGFITNEHIDNACIKKPFGPDMVSVFIATTPNPTSGFFIFVARKNLIDIDISVEEAMKLVISGGSILPEAMKKNSQ